MTTLQRKSLKTLTYTYSRLLPKSMSSLHHPLVERNLSEMCMTPYIKSTNMSFSLSLQVINEDQIRRTLFECNTVNWVLLDWVPLQFSMSDCFYHLDMNVDGYLSIIADSGLYFMATIGHPVSLVSDRCAWEVHIIWCNKAIIISWWFRSIKVITDWKNPTQYPMYAVWRQPDDVCSGHD